MHKIKSKSSTKPKKAAAKTASAPIAAAVPAKANLDQAKAMAAAVFSKPVTPVTRRVLNIVNINAILPRQLTHPQIQNIRLNENPAEADIVGGLKELSAIPDESCDFVWNANSLCYLRAHEVAGVLQQVHRIVKKGGHFLFVVPDMQRLGSYLTQGRLERALYRAPAGPITPLDLIYGHGASVAENPALEVRTGFAPGTIANKLTRAGFGDVEVKREGFSLHVNARKVPAQPADKPRVRYVDEETARVMKERDELIREPEIWTADLSALNKK